MASYLQILYHLNAKILGYEEYMQNNITLFKMNDILIKYQILFQTKLFIQVYLMNSLPILK